MRTPIGAISISPDSNLDSLERGECASFAVHSARRIRRQKRDKKGKTVAGGYGSREKKGEEASIARH